MSRLRTGLLLSPWLRTDLLLTSAADESYSRKARFKQHARRLTIRHISCHGQGTAAASRRHFINRTAALAPVTGSPRIYIREDPRRSHGRSTGLCLTATNQAQIVILKFYQKVRFSPFSRLRLLCQFLLTQSHAFRSPD